MATTPELRWKDLGVALRRRRKGRGLDQADVARMIDVAVNTVSRLERGDTASISTVFAVVYAVGWSAAEAAAVLAGEQDDAKPGGTPAQLIDIGGRRFYQRPRNPEKVTNTMFAQVIDLPEGAVVRENDVALTARIVGQVAEMVITNLAEHREDPDTRRDLVDELVTQSRGMG